jgi:hypothetical protein
MDRPRSCLAAVLLGLTVIAAATTAQGGPPPPPKQEPAQRKAGPEHARLTALCGTWDVELTFWFQPGGAGVSTRGTSTIRSLLNGLFIEEKIDGTLNGAPFTTLSWTGFNTETLRYEATRIASTNTIRIAEAGTYDEATRQFELKADYPFAGDTWHQRTVISPLSADAMNVKSYLSFGKVPEWKGVEITYARRARAKQSKAR